MYRLIYIYPCQQIVYRRFKLESVPEYMWLHKHRMQRPSREAQPHLNSLGMEDIRNTGVQTIEARLHAYNSTPMSMAPQMPVWA
jgi:hypothetical protein